MDHQSSTTLVRGTAAASAVTRSAASLTYESFYGLREKAFSLSTDPRFLFKSPVHAPAFDALLAGIRRREGLIVLTGEIGSGKTILCRAVLQHLDCRTFAAFVPDPFVSREDLLKTLLVQFGVASSSDLTRGRLRRASRTDLSFALYEFLDSLAPLEAVAVVIIDEAQNLTLPLLEEIRILSELERRDKLLQVVLVGQPELRANLKLPQMRQVDQRVSVRFELEALDAAGVARYVKHRLDIARDGDDAPQFTPAALEAVYRGSSGLPRLINRICDQALHRAYLARTFLIDARFVVEAIDDLELSTAPAADAPPTADRTAASSPVSPAAAAIAQPAVESAAVTVVTLSHEDSAALSHFAKETEIAGAPAAAIGHSVPSHSWMGRAIAASLAVVAMAGAAWWYANAASSDNALVPVPPPPPLRIHPQLSALRVPDEFAASELPRVEGKTPAAVPPTTESNEYVIQVASFANRARAEQLVAELTHAGYRAREVERDFGPPHGRLVVVLVGGYASALEVERDLRRIRELPGYGDARLLAPQPTSETQRP